MTQASDTGPTKSRSSTFLKIFLPILFIALAAGSWVYMRSTKPKAPSRAVQEKVWAVSIAQVEPGTYRPELEIYGQVETPRMTAISSALTAYVKTVPTDEGRAFNANDTLLTLDERDINLLVSQREADLRNAEAQLAAENVRYNADLKALKIEKDLLRLTRQSVERIESLKTRNLASQEQLDTSRRSAQQQALSLNSRQQAINDHPNRLKQLKANVQRSQAQYDAALLDLERSQIKVDFPGRIAKLHVAPGDRVRSGDPLLTLYGLDRLEVRAQIPSRLLPTVRAALSGEQQFSASSQLDNQQVALQLDRLAGEVNGGRAGVDAFFRLENHTQLPEPGRSVAVDLQLPPQSGLIALPPQALYGTDRIYKVEEGRLQAVTVERIGDITLNGKPHILVRADSLKPGEPVITTQLPNAISGLKVRDASIREDQP